MNVFDKFGIETNSLFSNNTVIKNNIFNHYPIVNYKQEIEDWEGHSDYVWLVDPGVKLESKFPIHMKPAPNSELKIHQFKETYKASGKVKSWESVQLIPTKAGTYDIKQHDYVASIYDPYKGKSKFDIFYIGENRIKYYNLKLKFKNLLQADNEIHAQQMSSTDMFWVIYDDIALRETFQFNYSPDDWSLDNVHVFANGKGDCFDGVALIPKDYYFNQKELDYRFYAKKKQIKIIASDPEPYEIHTINNYNDYLNALEICKTNMFWSVPSDVTPNFDFAFNYHVEKKDSDVVHVFKNGEYTDGIVLMPKNVKVTQKEIEHRFYVNKKELDIVAGYPKSFNKWHVKEYKHYLDALQNCKTDMFWMIYPGTNIVEDFNFDYYISHHETFDRNIAHVWKNGKFYDGLALVPKSQHITRKEFEYRFFANKKEHNEIASIPSKYDIVFISYNEPNADENYEKLKERFPKARRVHGIKGIHQAHIMAAKICTTEMFWVVDGDAQILDDFNFDYQIAHYDIDGKNTVHVWRSYNPINNLVYGYGGVKLLPRKLTLDMDITKPDMTTSISNKFKGIESMSNTTAFNTDEFSTWRSAFRECAKLASKTIHRQKDDETEFRLDAWCTRGKDKPFGDAAIAGAIHGRKYGEKYAQSPDDLRKINDFEWLQEQFNLLYQ
jgi:hypothetical protein